MARVEKVRLDDLLVLREMSPSKSQAKSLIMAGKVRTGTTILDKAGKLVPVDIEIELETPQQYVSRGAHKLEGFLKKFPRSIQGIRSLDVGASTGGFTDFLLQSGASSATCVDVGRGQLHYRLRKDERVHNFEKVNARYLSEADLPFPDYDLAVMDLSFISLKAVLPAVWPFVKPGGAMISLIKPQFEAGKEEVDKGKGIIRDPAIHQRVVDEILKFAEIELPDANLIGWCQSSIEGMNGNIEFLAGWEKLKS